MILLDDEIDDEFCAQEGTNGTLKHYRGVLKDLEASGQHERVKDIEACVDRILGELAQILDAVGSTGGE